MVDMPTPEANYRIIPREDGFAIEVSLPDTYPTIVSSFASEALAAAWIENHRAKALVKRTRRPTFRERSAAERKTAP
jgi:hypothetical protein